MATYSPTVAGGTQMDNLGYNYYPNTNQLSSVTDAAASTLYPDDVDTQVANNYA